jgi:hypothetical protein
MDTAGTPRFSLPYKEERSVGKIICLERLRKGMPERWEVMRSLLLIAVLTDGMGVVFLFRVSVLHCTSTPCLIVSS